MTQPDFAARNQVDALVRERKDALTVRWLIHTGAIGASAVLLAILAHTVPEPVATPVVALAWLIGLALAALSVVLPRRRLADEHLASWLRAPVDPYRWALQMKLTDEQKDAFMALPPAEQRVFGLTLLFEQPYVLGLNLALGVVLVGLGYGLIARTLIEAAPFLLGALALNCWHYPRLARLIDRGRVLQSAAQDEDTVRELVELQQQEEEEREAQPQRKSRVNPPSRKTKA